MSSAYTSGPGNLTTATSPFVSSTSVQLDPCSPAVNAGDPASTTAVGLTDLAGNPRIVAGRIDMGVYEFQGAVQFPIRLYVQASATGANTGLSWTDAFTDLQSALTFPCSQSLTEIWVASGIYKPTSTTDHSLSFSIRNGVSIYGGFVGNEMNLGDRPTINLTAPSSTTLSGDIGTVGNVADNSYHVIRNPPGLTNTAVLDGFAITAGNANGDAFPDNVGGGIYNDGQGNVCSPTIRNCSFQNNTATDNGGAMYNNGSEGTSSPVLTNCSFQNNTASLGGAMANAGVSIPVLTNCSFQNNIASFNGGAMYNDGRSGISSPVLTNCVLFGNGGANTFYNRDTNPSATFSLFEPSVTGYVSAPGNLTTTSSPFTSTATTRLRVSSPAINTGDPATTSATVGITDLASLPRFVGGRIDMGAVEVQDEMFTIATGNWNNPAIWNVGRIPQVGDRARLKHAVTIPANYSGGLTTLVYDPASRLIYGVGARLRLEP